ncbi:MAG: enoyl-CoA hydratase-related protein [Gemmobacter sp.]
MDDSVLVTDAGGVRTITLNRPAVMNALNRDMRARITAALLGHGARVVVLTGTGRAFCSGQDLSGSAITPADVSRTLREEYEPMLRAITGCPVPVIAAVNGAAAGAGANLALVCDVVIATESAFFQQSFTKIGLIPDAGGTWALPRAVGLQRAMGAMLFADRVTARQAADWGMIWDCVADDAFAATVAARAAHLATGPGVAFRGIKAALRASTGNTLDQQLAVEADWQGICGATADFAEGVAAFIEKRTARFTGA